MFALTLKDDKGNQVYHNTFHNKKLVKNLIVNYRNNKRLRVTSYEVRSTYDARILAWGNAPQDKGQKIVPKLDF